jgi:uncharacterized protein YjiS (DUF1127 family)
MNTQFEASDPSAMTAPAWPQVALGRFVDLLAKPGFLRRWFWIELERRRTKNQLQSLSNAELKDIGVDRSEIPWLAHMVSVHGVDPRGTNM